MRSKTCFCAVCLSSLLLLCCFFTSPGMAMAQENNILHIGMVNHPETLNFFASTDIWSKRILRFFYMPLYIHDPISRKRIPWLAKDDPLVGDDPHQVIVHLRNAKWNDGTDVTAQDLIFTFKVIKKFNVPGLVEKWKIVRGIEAINGKTVRFLLESPSAIFFTKTLFSSFVQKKNWETFIRSLDAETNPLSRLLTYEPERISSNGPFYLEKNVTPLFILLKKNPYFFGSGLEIRNRKLGPYINGIFLEFYKKSQEALKGFENGNTDFLWWDIPCDEFRKLKGKPSLYLYSTKRNGFDYLGFNLRTFPFNDKSLRKAISLVIDRKKLVARAIKGNGTEVYTFVPPEDIFWWNPNALTGIRDLSEKDRFSQARKLLAQAGFKWENNLLILPNGNRIEPVEILTTCAYTKPYRSLAALMIKKNLADIGIPSKVRMMPFHRLMGLLKQRKFKCYLMGWGNLTGEPLYLRTFFHSNMAEYPGRNYFGFKNSKFDQLAGLMMSEIDPVKRKELVFEMQLILASELPCIPLYSRNKTEVVRTTKFRGWMPLAGGIGNIWSFLMLRPVD